MELRNDQELKKRQPDFYKILAVIVLVIGSLGLVGNLCAILDHSRDRRETQICEGDVEGMRFLPLIIVSVVLTQTSSCGINSVL